LRQLAEDLVVAVRHLGTTVEFIVDGELDLASVPALRREIALALRHGPETAVVDLRDARFIDSSGLHALLATQRQAVAAGTRLVVIRPDGPADRAFSLSGLDDLFPRHEREDGADRASLTAQHG
jgi:anti-anti-sigma factor